MLINNYVLSFAFINIIILDELKRLELRSKTHLELIKPTSTPSPLVR